MSRSDDADLARLAKRLGGHWNGNSAMVRCPVHDDHTPSLSLRSGRRALLVHCFAGCDPHAVLRALRDIGPLPEAGVVPAARPASTALLVGVFRLGSLVAIQRLFLDPVSGERTARMMLGASRGGTWPARLDGAHLAVAEGFESACAYRQVTGRMAGTCFGAGNFARLPPPGEGQGYVLLPDNDPEGLRAARIGLDRLAGDGIVAAIEHCPAGVGDWGEMIRPAGRGPAGNATA